MARECGERGKAARSLVGRSAHILQGPDQRRLAGAVFVPARISENGFEPPLLSNRYLTDEGGQLPRPAMPTERGAAGQRDPVCQPATAHHKLPASGPLLPQTGAWGVTPTSTAGSSGPLLPLRPEVRDP